MLALLGRVEALEARLETMPQYRSEYRSAGGAIRNRADKRVCVCKRNMQHYAVS